MMHEYGDGVYCVDARYVGKKGLAAVYLVREGARTAVIDTAHNGALGPVLAAMERLSIERDEVDLILLTHVHLDHAGGAGSFMRAFPKARLVVHPRGVRHMVDPEKLVAGVEAVYGKEATERMYGRLLPVPPERVASPEDGEEISFGDRTIVCLYTPGHAKHHMAFYDPRTRAVFAGDAFGVAYASDGYGKKAVPTTSPVQFDPEAMHESIDRIVSLSPERVYLTHFGMIRDVVETAADLHRQVDDHVKLARDSAGDFAEIKAGILRLFEKEGLSRNWLSGGKDPDAPERGEMIDTLVELNAQGLNVWYGKIFEA